MTYADIVQDLVFRNYCHNRRLSPGISPERWEKVYGPGVWDMEKQFQAEQATIEEERGERRAD